MPQSKKRPQAPPDPDAGKTTLELIVEVVPNPYEWLKTPNTMFGGMSPQELLHEGTYAEVVRQRVLAYKYGVFA